MCCSRERYKPADERSVCATGDLVPCSGRKICGARLHSLSKPTMTRSQRLSVCYVDPGRDYRPGSSHTRQVLTLARALARDVEMSVVFRRLGSDPADAGCNVS